jgi:uncharacterized membrane protein
VDLFSAMNDILFSAIPYYLIFSCFGIIGISLTVHFTKATSLFAWVIAKPLGLLLFGYIIWILASVRIIKFNNHPLLIALFLLSLVAACFSIYWKLVIHDKLVRVPKDLLRVVTSKTVRKFIIFEVVAFSLFLGYLYIRSFSPALESTEKFMDLHLLMSSGKTDYFPFFDGWWADKAVNYYYYGFYLFSLLVRLSGVPYAVGYNLALGMILVCTVTIPFALTLKLTKSKFFSLLAAGLVAFAGNLHYASCFYSNYGPELATKCYYPKATRILDPSFTINEFPSYSFLLGDLHPHVISLPFFLTNLYLLYLIYKKKSINIALMIAYGFTLATAALINFWDFVTLGLLFAVVFFIKLYKRFKKTHKTKDTPAREFLLNFLLKQKVLIISGISFVVSPFILFLPFFFTFKSPVEGIGFAPGYVHKYLTEGSVKEFQYPSSFWFLFGIWGFYIVGFVLCLAYVLALKKIKRTKLIFPIVLFTIGIVLIILTETIYFKDLFHIANPSYFRANTVFKFGYHAWIILGISFAVMLQYLWKSLSHVKSLIAGIVSDFLFLGMLAAFCFTVFLFPVVGVNQAYAPSMPWNTGERLTFTLDGSKYIEQRNPGDYATIEWLNKNQKERIVILEAVGGSYTYFGRIGVNTGMGNVVNWESHQWTWRFHYPKDIQSWTDAFGKSIDTGYGEVAAVSAKVRKMYESPDIAETMTLLKETNVKYVYIGELERSTYAALNEVKFEELGTVVFQSGSSTLYEIK